MFDLLICLGQDKSDIKILFADNNFDQLVNPNFYMIGSVRKFELKLLSVYKYNSINIEFLPEFGISLTKINELDLKDNIVVCIRNFMGLNQNKLNTIANIIISCGVGKEHKDGNIKLLNQIGGVKEVIIYAEAKPIELNQVCLSLDKSLNQDTVFPDWFKIKRS